MTNDQIKSGGELLPCAHCGGEPYRMDMADEARNEGFQYIRCRRCFVLAPSVAAWNSRTPSHGRVSGEERDPEDMEAVGNALMDAINDYAEHPYIQGWHPCDCPSEIVGDLLNRQDELCAEIAALSTPAENGEQAADYEARYVHGGVPTDCVDYGVVRLSAGKEVCRVWHREDAEMIARLLNGCPATNPQPNVAAPIPAENGEDEQNERDHNGGYTLAEEADYEDSVPPLTDLSAGYTLRPVSDDAFAPIPVEGEVVQADREAAWLFMAAYLRGDAELTADSLAQAFARNRLTFSRGVDEVREAQEEIARLRDYITESPAVEFRVTDWRKVAKLAGEHGIRYRTNAALEAFLSALSTIEEPMA